MHHNIFHDVIEDGIHNALQLSHAEMKVKEHLYRKHYIICVL